MLRLDAASYAKRRTNLGLALTLTLTLTLTPTLTLTLALALTLTLTLPQALGSAVTNGAYYEDGRATSGSAFVDEPDVERAVWELSADLVAASVPRAQQHQRPQP